MSNEPSLTAVAQFSPTTSQRLAKAKFWDRIRDHWREPESYSVEEITRFVENKSFRSWTADSVFQSWFFNKNEAQHKLQAAAELAVDELIKVLQNPDMGPKGEVTAPAKVRAAEIIMNYAGMAPVKKTEVTAKTDAIQAMDQGQLREFLAGHMKRLVNTMTPEEIKNLLGDNYDKLLAIEGEVNE